MAIPAIPPTAPYGPVSAGLRAVISNTLTAPPSGPSVGDDYLVAASPTGAWAGQANKLAMWTGYAWQFYTPVTNDRIIVLSGTNASAVYAWNGTTWAIQSITTSGGFLGVGIAAPLSTLEVAGSLGVGIVLTGATPYAQTQSDHTIVLTLATTQVVTLLAASTCARRIITLVNATAAAKTTSINYSSDLGVGSNVIPAYGVLMLQSDGTNWIQINRHRVTAAKVTTITASGTFTPSPGAINTVVEMVGGGGGAGGCAATIAAQAAAAGHGNPGGYLKFQLTATQIGTAAVTVTIGAAGAAAAAGANAGGAGGATSFGAFATCNGGAGGGAGTAGAGVVGNGATVGGTTTLTTGTAILSLGGVATTGSLIYVTGSIYFGGLPTSTPLGAGGGFGFDGGTSRASIAGVGYGVGSSAPFSFASQAAKGSVAGQPGVCIVTEYF